MRIGVFDSGIGGLTVLRRLRNAFLQPDIIYLGDLARVPYGGRSEETIHRYACEDVNFLLKCGVDAVIVACGTVSSTSLEVLRRTFSLPIYGVIESAAAKAVDITRSGVVGVIGTQATVKSNAYDKLIHARREDIRVISQACPLFVPLVENGITAQDPVAEIITDRYMRTFDNTGTDTLIMGCTHYPVFRSALEKRLPGIQLIDVGEALTEMLHPSLIAEGGHGETVYYVTERSAAFHEVVRIMDSQVNPEKVTVVSL